jgi:hypothetical protein
MQRVRALHPQDWVKWAGDRYETYSLERFWKPPRGVEPERSAVLPQAPALYTASFHAQVLDPLQHAAHRYIPELQGSIDAFAREYWTAYFQSWASFYREFYRGARLWSPDYMSLAHRLVEQPLPYEQLFSDMDANIWTLPLRMPLSNRMALLWLDIKNDWSSTPQHVAKTFRQWRAGLPRVGTVEAPTWVLAIAEMHKKVWPETSATAKKFVQFVQQDAKGQDSVALARAVFKNGGAGGSGLAQDFLKLNQAFDAMPDKFVQRTGPDDQIGWGGAKGPARLVLIILAARAGEYLQHRWDEDIVKPAAAMNSAEQDVVLWGEKGRINAFLTEQLDGFVLSKEQTPVQVLDVTLPFSTGYSALVNKAAAGNVSKEPFLIGTFSFKQPSSFGTGEEGAQGSEFSLICRGSTVALRSKAKLVADRSIKVYWSPELCDRVRIEIYLPDQASAQPSATQAPAQQSNPAIPASLAKDYLGGNGFKQLLQDFDSGAKTFALSDFRSSYAPADWQAIMKSLTALGINSVKVHLTIDKSPEADRFLKATQIIASGLPPSIMQ